MEDFPTGLFIEGRETRETYKPSLTVLHLLEDGTLSTAYNRGLRIGDEILGINTHTISSDTTLYFLVPETITIQRKGIVSTIEVPEADRATFWDAVDVRPVERRTVRTSEGTKEEIRHVYDLGRIYDFPGEVEMIYQISEEHDIPEKVRKEAQAQKHGPVLLLKSLILRAKDTGKTSDVLSKCNKHNYTICCLGGTRAPGTGFDCVYHKTRIIYNSMPNLPATISILLHEGGHAAQFAGGKDSWYARMHSLAGLGRSLLEGALVYVHANDLVKLYHNVPSLTEIASLDTIEWFSHDYNLGITACAQMEQPLREALSENSEKDHEWIRRLRLFYFATSFKNADPIPKNPSEEERERLAPLEQALQEQGWSQDRMKHYFHELASTYRAIAPSWRALVDPLFVVARMTERDATCHALRWMREIRDECGLDLTKPIPLKEEKYTDTDLIAATDFEGRAARDTQALRTKINLKHELRHGKKCLDVVKLLGGFLESYGATSSQMREKYGTTPHPMVLGSVKPDLWQLKHFATILSHQMELKKHLKNAEKYQRKASF